METAVDLLLLGSALLNGQTLMIMIIERRSATAAVVSVKRLKWPRQHVINSPLMAFPDSHLLEHHVDVGRILTRFSSSA